MQFNDYSIEDLVNLIHRLHLVDKLSLRAIAKQLGTYPTKILRFCNKHGIPTMTGSESLKEGYASKRITNANKGKELSEERKRQISEHMHTAWSGLSDEERSERANVHREAFLKRSDKDSFSLRGSQAIRRAAIEGSKLEKYLIEVFNRENIQYIHHYKGLFGGTKLEADFFLPGLGIVVEVDGPSHFTSNLSDDTLHKQQQADNKKNGLVIAAGASIVRIQHFRTLYQRDFRIIEQELLAILPTLSNEMRIIHVD